VIRTYKARGAYIKIAKIHSKHNNPTIVCASSGNHGMGVAYVCKKLKLAHHIFLPMDTHVQKQRGIKFFGGE